MPRIIGSLNMARAAAGNFPAAALLHFKRNLISALIFIIPSGIPGGALSSL